MSWPQEVIERFDARPSPWRANTWSACCPVHDDQTPSLRIWLGKKCLLIGCYAGCNKLEILASRGLRMADLFPPDSRNAYGHDRAITPRYISVIYGYTDEQGTELYQKVRYEPKYFSLRHWDRKLQQWIPSIDGCRRVLYRLHVWHGTDHRIPIILVEGEKAVHAAESLGLLATCSPFGANSGWDDEVFANTLRGRRVIILPDNDVSGFKHADRVAGSLMRHGCAGLRTVILPGIPEGGDLHDWVEAGGTREEFTAQTRSQGEWKDCLTVSF